MARIRSIKPEFWASEQVLELSRDARLLFIGLWNFADDAGRFKWSPKTIRAQIFPGDDDVTSADVERWLSEIVHCGLTDQYVNGHGTYGQITGWHHQKINRKNEPKYPGPHDSGSGPGALTECAVNGHRESDQEGIGREGIKDPKDPPYPPEGAGAQGESFLEPPLGERMATRFRSTWLSARQVDPSMGGKSLAGFPARVEATADAQGMEPMQLFERCLAAFLAGEIDDVARRAPYAVFAARFSDLADRSPRSNHGGDSEERKARELRKAREDAEREMRAGMARKLGVTHG